MNATPGFDVVDGHHVDAANVRRDVSMQEGDAKRRPSVLLVAGARPNFMKVAPLLRAFSKLGRFAVKLVHTGQHYDEDLSAVFLRDLELPAPDFSLGVGPGSHGAQTARVLERFEQVLLTRTPNLVIVVGDVNSTLACALAAAKVTYPSGHRPLIAHVEAGLRSFDRGMPEEINRVLTDAVSDYLFTSERSANENLRREGIPDERVFFVGNVMIDTLLQQRERARAARTCERFGLEPGKYGVVTLHRPTNVDHEDTLRDVMRTLAEVSRSIPLVFPVHPRTRESIERMPGGAARAPGLVLTPPLGYLEFLSLLMEAKVVLTDSGGIQEETTILGVPCVTLRDRTERPITLTEGSNRLVGVSRNSILAAVAEILSADATVHRQPELWDGGAAERIVAILAKTIRPYQAS